jgi:hypothetical protein
MSDIATRNVASLSCNREKSCNANDLTKSLGIQTGLSLFATLCGRAGGGVPPVVYIIASPVDYEGTF